MGWTNLHMKDLLKCLAFDLKLFGMCFVNVIWNKPRTKIVEMYHIPSQYIRSGKADGYGRVNEYYYSADWTNTRKHKPRTYKAFDEKDRTNASQVLCIKDYSPGSYYYSLPDYQGSTSYIQLDMEVAQFHLSNIKSGMFPSMAVNFANGVPTREERRTIERQINSKFGGSGNAGKILITFNDGKDTAPEIVPINANDNSDSYQFLSTETTRKVLTGHRVTSPLLFGVKGDGSGFGNNADELRDSFSLFMNSVVKPMQNTILEGLQPLFSINDINLDLYFKSLKPADFIDIENVAKIDEDDQEKEGIDVQEDSPNNEVVETPEDTTEEKDEVMEEPLEKEASYNGAQISSAIDIIAKVGEGILTKEQATVFLIQFLQLPPEVAKGFFSEGESAVEKLTESINLKKDIKKKLKSLKDIDTKPTKGMIEEAKKGLEWRKEYKRGGTQVAVSRARDIINGKLSIKTIKRMNSFFARHESDKSGKGFKIGEEGFPSAGRIAWALWGGDAGQSWAKKKVKEIENVEELTELSDDEFENVLDNLNAEVIGDEWEVVDERDQGSDEGYEEWADRFIQKREDFANYIDSKPSGFSYLDKSYYKIRFKYIKKSTRTTKTGESRPFCKKMMSRTRDGKVYRIEDIDKASREGVNKQLGHKGRAYDLFKYKGGVYCTHAWAEVLYRLKKGTTIKDGKAPKDINDYKKVSDIPKSYKAKPRGYKESQEPARPSNNWWKYPGTK